MSDYKPPFQITEKMLNSIASISEKITRISFQNEIKAKPHLRRNNRIKSIHSSLKIEANSLSLSEVRDVIDGHQIVGNIKEIQEVKNAYNAYTEIKTINPYSVSDLKRVHGIMTFNTVEESGTFRKGQEGVFKGNKCIFIAPPPHMVPKLIQDLFEWMQENKTILHPLLLSAVFHYEFVFIHPFSDGNGRMARLWHTAILTKWKSEFEYIPLESQIEKFQDSYYKAIEQSNASGNANAFVEFILTMIDKVLDDISISINKTNSELSIYVKRLLSVMDYDIPYTALEIMQKLNLKSKETFRKNYINPAIQLELVQMTVPDKPNSKNQRYVKH